MLPREAVFSLAVFKTPAREGGVLSNPQQSRERQMRAKEGITVGLGIGVSESSASGQIHGAAGWVMAGVSESARAN